MFIINILMRISILVPSRERPNRFKTFVDSVLNNSKNVNNISIYCYLDSDDPTLSKYEQFSENVKYIIGDPISISKSWNIIAEKAYQDGNDVFMMGNDDQVYHTKYWDEILLNHMSKLPHRYFCIWFKDGIQNNRLATFPILTKNWYELLDNRFTPGIFNYCFNDTWIFDIAQRAKVCYYIDEVFVEHQHALTDKKYHDRIYVKNSKFKATDKEVYENNISERILLAQRIRDKINENSSL